MFKDKVKGFLKDYIPERLDFEERLNNLRGLRELIRQEELPLEALRDDFRRLVEEIKGSDKKALEKWHFFLNRLAIRAFEESHSVKDVHFICTKGRDEILKRVLVLVGQELGLDERSYAWIALGSAGRQEETLYTDQDYMLVYEGEDTYFREFSERVSDCLERAGIKKCKGGVMPLNEKWRGTLAQWRERISSCAEKGRGVLGPLELMILMDMRLVMGNEDLWQEFQKLRPLLVENKGLLNEMVSTLIFVPLPLGLLGRFVTEKTGPYRGMVNLKTGGWAPLVVLIRVVATAYGIYETSTLRRIEGLKEKGVVSPEMATELENAYHILMQLRIKEQVKAVLKGEEASNYIDPYRLSHEEQKELRTALRKIEEFQRYTNELFFGKGRA